MYKLKHSHVLWALTTDEDFDASKNIRQIRHEDETKEHAWAVCYHISISASRAWLDDVGASADTATV